MQYSANSIQVALQGKRPTLPPAEHHTPFNAAPAEILAVGKRLILRVAGSVVRNV